MRQAKSGGLLIQVRGDHAQIEAVRAEVSRSAGSDVQVSTVQPRASCEIRDLDEWTSKEEVLEAVNAATGTMGAPLKANNLRKLFGGTQAVTITGTTESVRKLVNQGRILIGMVSCRIRLVEPRQRCFKCFSTGHMANACSGPDRSGCCRCGIFGHKAASRDATDEKAAEFATVLQDYESRNRSPECT